MDIPETNLNDMNFNFPTDISNQLDPEGGLLSLNFDNIYGCDSENPSRSVKYEIEDELRASPDIIKLNQVPTDSEDDIKMFEELKLKKKLQQLILCNLDLIQYQSEQIILKDKMYEALQQENEMLKNRLKVIQEMIGENQSNVNPPPLVHTIQRRPPNIIVEDSETYEKIPGLGCIEGGNPTYIYDRDVKPYRAKNAYEAKVNPGKRNNLRSNTSSKKRRVANGKSRKKHSRQSRRITAMYQDEDYDDEEEKFLSSLSRRRRRCSDSTSANCANDTVSDGVSDLKIVKVESSKKIQNEIAIKKEPSPVSGVDLSIVKTEK